jgi:hypothetical protein
MTRAIALGSVVAGIVLIAIAYAAAFLSDGAPAWAAWPYMIGTSTAMVGMMVLGAARGRGGIGRLVWPFTLIYAVLLAGFGAVLLMPPESTTTTTLWLGLPARAAIIIYGIGILPLFLLPIAYALTFDSMTMSEEDLARLAEMRRERLGRAPATERRIA